MARLPYRCHTPPAIPQARARSRPVPASAPRAADHRDNRRAAALFQAWEGLTDTRGRPAVARRRNSYCGDAAAAAHPTLGTWIGMQLVVEVAPQVKQLDEGADDHVGPRTRRTTGHPRKMGDWELFDTKAQPAPLDQELSREGRAAGVHGYAFPYPPPKQLEGAIHVTRGVAEQAVDEELPAQGVELAHEGVGAITPPADNQISLSIHRGYELAELPHVELLVSVCEEHQVLMRRVEAAGQRGAVPAVLQMRHDAQVQVWLLVLESGQNLSSSVARAVVGDDHLEIGGQCAQHPSDVADGALDHGFFVIGGQHRRDTHCRAHAQTITLNVVMTNGMFDRIGRVSR